MRRLGLLAVLVSLPLLSADADDAADARRKKIETAKAAAANDVADFKARVNGAIDRGVAWLRTKQKSTGAFPGVPGTVPGVQYNPMDLGVNALVLLTLATSGVPNDDKAVERLKTYVLSDYANMKGKKQVKTYTASVLILALDAMYNPGAKEESTAKKDRYVDTTAKKRTPCKYPAWVHGLIAELVKFLKEAQIPNLGAWRYPGNDVGAPQGDADLSNLQYALLGLNAAARCGFDVPTDVFTRAMEYVVKEQEKDGLPTDLFVENPAWEPGADDVPRWTPTSKRKARGWTYLQGLKEPCTGSMTCAGVAALAIVKERLTEAGKCPPEVRRRLDAGILDGVAWLADAFTVTDNPVVPPAPAMWHYYYLYGLERVGALTGLAYVGKNDWYRLGAEHLLSAQQKDGRWQSGIAAKDRPADHTESEVVQTCFALLFLKRSTVPPLVPVTPEGLTPSGDAERVDGRGGGSTDR